MKHYPHYSTRKVSTLRELITTPARKTPHKDVFRIRTSKESYRSISWKEFESDINALGTALIEKGLKGSNICVIGENSYEWILTYMSVVNGVGAIVAVDKDLQDEEIKNIIINSDAKAVVFSNTYQYSINVMKKDLVNVAHYICINPKKNDFVSLSSLIGLGNEIIQNGGKQYLHAEIDTTGLAALIYTSGTTGQCKGVMLSQNNMIANISAAASMVFCGPDDVVMSILPTHHTYEFTCNILAVFLCEATICINESMKHIKDNLKLYKPTLLFLVPLIAETVYKNILAEAEKNGKLKKLNTGVKVSNALRFVRIDIRKKIFSDIHDVFGGRLKKIVLGGAPMNPFTAKALRNIGILVLQGYGITECSPLVAVNRERHYKDHSVGLAVPCNKVKIKDGEILVKGENVMLGYYKNPEATAEAFDGEWFKTGDLGYIDEDGFLYITGRKKNLIILDNGKNVYPEEIEGYLAAIEQIKEAVVYEENKLIAAEIYPDPETDNAEQIIRDRIALLNKTLPIYKQVQSIKFRQTEFEKTTTKKIKRHKVGVNANV